jgi:hypothetical protein
MNNTDININLTKNEAWVLFDIVKRYSDTDKLKIEHQAEERALWNLCCIFEKTLTLSDEDSDYNTFIKNCRNELKDEDN